ncbi:TetR/AcrR family transcriptional regulator [Bradyrhizobium sp. LHD-71]|uniref:TetR/AcrR family transcriptional regulator n=1 Tax=Bradyrhizobium sp. LHD-71 TaxID=3072141 RepID=UPI00280C82BE|nr:TetR/AcrR family transcriptional regulator [Bradyrhizobium sp. LHD-71]MDQ8727380.1 TetR/AcrR family transcriptional regulator [Bradyrhizobium sp. LHD-71]
MARHKEFDRHMAIDAAIAVFREHGYEGASTGMLMDRMGIGRQSLYDTFGDKWQLYQAALQRYSVGETSAHATALKQGPRAVDGIRAMLARVVERAMEPCLGVSAICEFGRSKPELSQIQDACARGLRTNISKAVREAQVQGSLAGDSDPGEIADFLVACIAGIRIAARGGAGRKALNSLARHAMLALR